jgi:hypothetical protein
MKTTTLDGDTFFESFLVGVWMIEWPNEYRFDVWSPMKSRCYSIVTKTVLEMHYVRAGVDDLRCNQGGLPLFDIYLTRADEYKYWDKRLHAFDSSRISKYSPPFCIEFNSPALSNRRYKIFTRDKNVGLLVVCRKFSIKVNRAYHGPRPSPVRIPSDG